MPRRSLNRLMVANRGEIACRIIRSAQELGIHTTTIYSECDRESLAVKLADHAVEIGPAPAARSYLNGQAILEAAQANGIDAIHPGYGFLAENAEFAEAVEKASIIFVGPSSATIRLMGDKLAARACAQNAGVPIAQGSESGAASIDEMCTIADRIGYPVLIKASAGGGGRGIRIAENREDMRRLAPQAKAEAQAAFGNGTLFIEKFIRRARHIEVQILGDGERIIHCFERECSMQRRRQKVWEEAPAYDLTDESRRAICESAVTLARKVSYRGAGTVEYLYDKESEAFYFLEMNTRIQVEHPVTECITGIDLIREMLLIAAGRPMRIKQGDVGIRGHSIECRINAEDPFHDFMPNPGRVESIAFPAGPGVRFDSMLYPGCEIPPYYDSMLAKLIVWDESREYALRRLRRALSELRIEGIKTTIPLHKGLAGDDVVVKFGFDTEFLERRLSENSLELFR